MFIQTEQTPNPAVLKFLPGCEVLGTGHTAEFSSADHAAEASPLAERLFYIDGVTGVFLGNDFISVTKAEEREWQTLKPHILAAIMDHFTAGFPVLADEGALQAAQTQLAGEVEPEDELGKQIKELIDTRVRPAVAMDGGDIVYQGFENDSGIVYLAMRGACAGCPSSTMTLKMGIENMLKHFVPEVTAVEAVN